MDFFPSAPPCVASMIENGVLRASDINFRAILGEQGPESPERFSGGLIWPKNPDFVTFLVISGLWGDQWMAAWISTILTFHGGSIRAIQSLCR